MRKKILPLITLILAQLFFAASAFAHPPEALDVVTDLEKQTITVNITHNVAYPTAHYIKTVEIKKNGQLLISDPHKDQPSKDKFFYTYQGLIKEGDMIEVKAVCNIYGSRNASVKVTKTVPPKPQPKTEPQVQQKPDENKQSLSPADNKSSAESGTKN